MIDQPGRPEFLPASGVEGEIAGERFNVWQFHSVLLPAPDARSVVIYLPERYASEPSRRFPVFYLHDGQNLFDPSLSFIPGRTWRAHASADRLTLAGEIEPVILVGIANTGIRRMAEYTPSHDPRMGGGEGDAYGRLLIDEVKPFIDAQYRTLPDSRNTALGGSSLGGLISLYLGFKYPAIFGKLAVMSPSLWWDHRRILRTVARLGRQPDLRIWLDMGTSEGVRHLRDADLLHQRLLCMGWQDGADLAYQRAEGAVHDETAWAERFPNALRFLFPRR